MPETIDDCGSGAKWHWYNVQADVQQQGHLSDVHIDPFTVGDHGCGGAHGGNLFYLTWVHDTFLLVSMQRPDQQLVDAFSVVVGYKPFWRYTRDGMVTMEWDKQNPDQRYRELQNTHGVVGLERI